MRAAEAAAMSRLPSGELMQRAARALAAECVEILSDRDVRVSGASVALLVGSGDNGGDALYAGAALAARGAQVTALCCSARIHESGHSALRKVGGRSIPADDHEATAVLASADLVLDGILGIGGKGALREPAATAAIAAAASDATVVAVDLPSGVDADTGAVADPGAAVTADVTVALGCLKPGLVVPPGAFLADEVRLVDIGIGPDLPARGAVARVDELDAGCWLPVPGQLDDKYSRGVVGVVAGSDQYPGAGVLCTGAARLGGVGLVRYAGTATAAVMARWPDVVPSAGGPADAGRVNAWIIGPGAGTDDDALARLRTVLESDVPVLIDADGVTLLAGSDDLRDLVRRRHQLGVVTVVTPHEGEFARLGFTTGADRLGAVVGAARELGSVVLLKGAVTLVAEPAGTAWANTTSSPCLATGGSGDVLSGLAGSMLAANSARGLDIEAGAEILASAAYVHGRAGQLAAAAQGPVTAVEVLAAVGPAIAELRVDAPTFSGIRRSR